MPYLTVRDPDGTPLKVDNKNRARILAERPEFEANEGGKRVYVIPIEAVTPGGAGNAWIYIENPSASGRTMTLLELGLMSTTNPEIVIIYRGLAATPGGGGAVTPVATNPDGPDPSTLLDVETGATLTSTNQTGKLLASGVSSSVPGVIKPAGGIKAAAGTALTVTAVTGSIALQGYALVMFD